MSVKILHQFIQFSIVFNIDPTTVNLLKFKKLQEEVQHNV